MSENLPDDLREEAAYNQATMGIWLVREGEDPDAVREILSDDALTIFEDLLESEGREMASTPAAVPPNAIPIGDESEAPEGAKIVKGPRGGTYYIPTGGTKSPEDAESESETGTEEAGDEYHPPDPEEDIPRFMGNEEMDRKIDDLHEVQYENGFTLNADLTPYNGLGYVATITSDNYQHPEAGGEGVDKEAIVELYERLNEVLQEFPARVKLGTFYGDDGYMSVDLNIVTPNREVAEDIGEGNNQQAVWDLYQSKPIPTGGTGESPISGDDPEEIIEFIREVVAGRELKIIMAEGETPPPAYVAPDGETYSSFEVFGKLKSGTWTLTDYDEGVFVVETAEGETLELWERASGRDMALPEDTTEEPPFVDPDGRYTEVERAFHSIYNEVLWMEDEPERHLFGFLDTLPQNVRDRIVTAIMAGSMFETFEDMSQHQREEMQNWLVDQARSGAGWSVSELAAHLRDIDPSLGDYEAERIARTESQAIVTKAREQWYEDDFDADDEPLFIWQGPQDHRTTEACTWLKEQANPTYGGEPKTIPELKELVREASDRFFPDLRVREWTVHPFERHTIVRYYDYS